MIHDEITQQLWQTFHIQNIPHHVKLLLVLVYYQSLSLTQPRFDKCILPSYSFHSINSIDLRFC